MSKLLMWQLAKLNPGGGAAAAAGEPSPGRVTVTDTARRLPGRGVFRVGLGPRADRDRARAAPGRPSRRTAAYAMRKSLQELVWKCKSI